MLIAAVSWLGACLSCQRRHQGLEEPRPTRFIQLRRLFSRRPGRRVGAKVPLHQLNRPAVLLATLYQKKEIQTDGSFLFGQRMPTFPLYPVLAGLQWPMGWKHLFSRRITSEKSGRRCWSKQPDWPASGRWISRSADRSNLKLLANIQVVITWLDHPCFQGLNFAIRMFLRVESFVLARGSKSQLRAHWSVLPSVLYR